MASFVSITQLAVVVTTLLCCHLWTPCSARGILSCQSGSANVTSLKVNGCDDSNPRTVCRLVKGTTKHMELKFTIPAKLCEAKVSVKGNIRGVDLPFMDGDATEFGLKDNCLSAGEEHTVILNVNVRPMYPEWEVGVKIFLTGHPDNGAQQTAFCVLIPSKICRG